MTGRTDTEDPGAAAAGRAEENPGTAAANAAVAAAADAAAGRAEVRPDLNEGSLSSDWSEVNHTQATPRRRR
jgi:hypothetical protein